jgi:hypothetical protein
LPKKGKKYDSSLVVAEAVLRSPIRHHSEHQRMSLPTRIGARHPGDTTGSGVN